ncbi:MAG TPA: hypothetical protein VFB62_28190 [Polyangiaceae bacterium]|jgi:hypothetical protein|nr:hypothetical protein [Polyangiaceae bacterium]
MSTHDFNRWRAQQPPDDFADRVVKAMISEAPQPLRRRSRRGWLGGIGLAAVLLGASAWGMLEAERTALPEAIVRLSDSARESAPEVADGRTAPPPPAPPVVEETPEVDAPVHRVAPPKPKAKPTSNREPMCHCETDLAVCGCLE